MVQDFQENYGSGWVSIYRSIKNHWIFDNDKYFKWWVIMLFEVNHKDRKFTRYYNIYDIKRGQSCNSLRTWAELFKTTPKTVSKFFDMLEKDKMIYSEKIGKGKQALTLVTIANYIDYQNKSKQDLPQEVNTEETRSKQDLPTNNNANNYNNENKREIELEIALTPFELIEKEKPSALETWNSQNLKYINDFDSLVHGFNNTAMIEIFSDKSKLEFNANSLFYRFSNYARAWISNQKPDQGVPVNFGNGKVIGKSNQIRK